MDIKNILNVDNIYEFLQWFNIDSDKYPLYVDGNYRSNKLWRCFYFNCGILINLEE